MKAQLELMLVAVSSWLGIGIVNAADTRLAKGSTMLAQAGPDVHSDILASFTLTTFLVLGSLMGAYVYFAGTWVKDKVFRQEPTQYKLYFASGAFLLGMLLGLVAAKLLVPSPLDRGWVFVIGAGGSLASWGVYDALLVFVVAKARSVVGGNNDKQAGN